MTPHAPRPNRSVERRILGAIWRSVVAVKIQFPVVALLALSTALLGYFIGKAR